jgi:hypothetical protein
MGQDTLYLGSIQGKERTMPAKKVVTNQKDKIAQKVFNAINALTDDDVMAWFAAKEGVQEDGPIYMALNDAMMDALPLTGMCITLDVTLGKPKR